MDYSIQDFIGHQGRISDLGYVIRSLPEYILESMYGVTNFPEGGGGAALDGTTMTTTVKRSQRPGVNYEVEAKVDASSAPEVAATQWGPGVGLDTVKVYFDVKAFFEAPSEDVTQYSAKALGTDKYGDQDYLDEQDGKSGCRFHVNAAYGSKSWVVQWKNAKGEVVSTDIYTVDVSGVKFATYEVTAKTLTVAETALKLTLDKPLPEGIKYTAKVSGIEGDLTFVADGTSTEITLTDKAEATQTYELTSLTGDHTNVTGNPKFTPAAAGDPGMAGPSMISADVTADKAVATTTTKKKATKKTKAVTQA